MSETGQFGTYLMSWSQIQIDGHDSPKKTALVAGAYLRWTGDAVDLTPAIKPVAPDRFESLGEAHWHFAHAAREVVATAMGQTRPTPAQDPDKTDRSFALSDGDTRWTGTMITVPNQSTPLLVFAGSLPPANTPLRVDWIETRPTDTDKPQAADGVVCFTPGTWIDTPRGARQVEHLSAGDKVVTADGGIQELVWTGLRHLTLGELRRTPDLAPIRIKQGALGQRRAEGDLVVSPDHRMLVRGRYDRWVGHEDEFLVSARDLVDGETVTREPPWRTVAYIHLLLERHHVLIANGFETESFHPGAAALSAIPEPDRLRLFDILPILQVEPAAYGPSARPVVTAAEAALIAAA